MVRRLGLRTLTRAGNGGAADPERAGSSPRLTSQAYVHVVLMVLFGSTTAPAAKYHRALAAIVADTGAAVRAGVLVPGSAGVDEGRHRAIDSPGWLAARCWRRCSACRSIRGSF